MEEAHPNRKRIAQVIRTVIAVGLILYPILNFLIDLPSVSKIIGGGDAETSVVENQDGGGQ